MEVIDQILDYVLGLLEENAKSEFEASIKYDEVLHDVVDGIKKFCEDYNIKTKEDFYEKWGEGD